MATDGCDPGIFICDVVKTYSDTCRNCGPGENYNGVRKSQAYNDLAQTLHWRPTLQRSCGTVVTFECGSSAIICLDIFNGERLEEVLENGRQIVFQYSGEISLPLITHNYSQLLTHRNCCAGVTKKFANFWTPIYREQRAKVLLQNIQHNHLTHTSHYPFPPLTLPPPSIGPTSDARRP